jgi:hypothetical protein
MRERWQRASYAAWSKQREGSTMNVRELTPEQGYKRKVANALDLYQRGYLTKEQVVRLCKRYRLEAERR